MTNFASRILQRRHCWSHLWLEARNRLRSIASYNAIHVLTAYFQILELITISLGILIFSKAKAATSLQGWASIPFSELKLLQELKENKTCALQLCNTTELSKPFSVYFTGGQHGSNPWAFMTDASAWSFSWMLQASEHLLQSPHYIKRHGFLPQTWIEKRRGGKKKKEPEKFCIF